MAHFNFVISQNAKWGHAGFYIDCHRMTVPENNLLQKSTGNMCRPNVKKICKPNLINSLLYELMLYL